MGIFARRKPDQAQLEQHESRERLDVEIATVRAVLARYPRGTCLHFGAPTKCPACGDYGFVRAVNKARGTSQLDCFGCHTDWVISVAALKAVVDEPTPEIVEIVPLTPARLPDEIAIPAPTPATPLPIAARVPAPAAPAIVQLDPLSIIMDSSAAPPVVPDHPSIRPVASPVTPRAAEVRPAAAARPAQPVGEQLQVLVVDDNPFDVAVLDELLGGLPQGSVELHHAATLAEGVQHTLGARVDVVLLDLGLPDSTGISTLLEWQLAATTGVPVIVVTGDSHPETVREAQLLGAAQFVHKQHVADLVNRADGSAKLLRLLQTTAAQANQRTPSA